MTDANATGDVRRTIRLENNFFLAKATKSNNELECKLFVAEELDREDHLQSPDPTSDELYEWSVDTVESNPEQREREREG